MRLGRGSVTRSGGRVSAAIAAIVGLRGVLGALRALLVGVGRALGGRAVGSAVADRHGKKREEEGGDPAFRLSAHRE